MAYDPGDRSNQVKDDGNNDNGQKSSIPISIERHRNEEKNS